MKITLKAAIQSAKNFVRAEEDGWAIYEAKLADDVWAYKTLKIDEDTLTEREHARSDSYIEGDVVFLDDDGEDVEQDLAQYEILNSLRTAISLDQSGTKISEPDKLVVYTNGSIGLDGINIGLSVRQRADGTVVYTPEKLGARYQEHKMPSVRYSLSHLQPASGVAGRGDFERDLRSLLLELPRA